MREGYAKQLAITLRTKTDELLWLFIEAEGRLAISREWTEEARAAGEPTWATRYKDDIEVLESALEYFRAQFNTALSIKSQEQSQKISPEITQIVDKLHENTPTELS